MRHRVQQQQQHRREALRPTARRKSAYLPSPTTTPRSQPTGGMFRRALHRILSSTAAANPGMFSLPAVQKKEEEEEEEEEGKARPSTAAGGKKKDVAAPNTSNKRQQPPSLKFT